MRVIQQDEAPHPAGLASAHVVAGPAD